MKKMYCVECDKEVITKIIEKEETANIKGLEITCKIKVRVCPECGEELLDPDLEDENLDLFYNEYRKQKKLLSPEEIKAIRLKYNLSQTSFARLLGFGEKTIARYENGSIQDTAHDNLIRSMSSVDAFFRLWELRKDCLTENDNKRIKIACEKYQYTIEYGAKKIAAYVVESSSEFDTYYEYNPNSKRSTEICLMQIAS